MYVLKQVTRHVKTLAMYAPGTPVADGDHNAGKVAGFVGI